MTIIKIRGLKINTFIDPAVIAGANLVPPEPAPAGNPTIGLQLDGSSLNVRVTLNGKSVRRAVKAITEHGAENVNVVLQGNLKGANAGGWNFELDSAGLTVQPKAVKAVVVEP